MPIDPRNPDTLIIEGDTDHRLEISRADNMIYIHTNGRLISPIAATIGVDEDMATMICDGLTAMLLRTCTRVISRSQWAIEEEQRKRRMAAKIDAKHPPLPDPDPPSLEDL